MFSKSECLRLKGIIEPLNDIMVRHYGEYWRIKHKRAIDYKDQALNYINKMDGLHNRGMESSNEALLMIAIEILEQVEKDNWDALLHQNDKLDV